MVSAILPPMDEQQIEPDLLSAGEPARPPRPGLVPFLMGRIKSRNGVFSALWLVLTAWVWADPPRARRLWRRLQGLPPA